MSPEYPTKAKAPPRTPPHESDIPENLIPKTPSLEGCTILIPLILDEPPKHRIPSKKKRK